MSLSSYDDVSDRPSPDAATQVRRAAGSAAIAAVLMCLYGFGSLQAPEPTDLFGWCNLFFFYTLRIGGITYAIITVWCLMGHASALIADGVLSLLVGAMFMLTGIGMLIDGGAMLNSVLITVFGWLFAGSGLRDFNVHRNVTQAGAVQSLASTAPAPERTNRSHEWQASRAQSETDAKSYPDKETDRINHTTDADPVSDGSSDESAAPTDDGFLADFAKKGGPPRV